MAAGRRTRVLGGALAAVVLVVIGGLVGFSLGTAAGDPSREVTGVVDNVNDHAIALTGVEGEDDGTIAAAFIPNPDIKVQPGDTVTGTFVEFNEPDLFNTFFVLEVVSSSGG
jgi:hypothetical protein